MQPDPRGLSGGGLGLYCKVYLTVAQAITASGFTTVLWNAVRFNPYSMWLVADPGKIRIPVSGIWRTGGTFGFAANNVGYRRAGIGPNGNFTNSTIVSIGNAGAVVGTIVNMNSGLIELKAGDYLEMRVDHDSSTSPLNTTSTEPSMNMWAELVSPYITK